MILEKCNGVDVQDDLQNVGTYSEQRAAEVFVMMVRAVGFCHAHGLCHRDIKLDNFMFSEPFVVQRTTGRNKHSLPKVDSGNGGLLKLLDFGLSARFLDDDGNH